MKSTPPPPISKVSKDQRLKAKAVNFGLVFGQSVYSMRESAQVSFNTHLTWTEAHRFKERFFEAYKGLAEWHERVKSSTELYTTTLSGRKRKFSKKWFEAMLNAPIQGTCADVLKRALGSIPVWLPETESRLVGIVHDEIIVETPVEHTEKSAEFLKISMIEAGEFFIKTVPIEVDIEIGENWGVK
jgi:DNA polymerase I-like protein with 3'-5' exonuclease and polymerase domains